jgi:2-polyprenyl-3-methyl-5-hydroxy-6-metoxy-1,4-benzoquinol methylase
MSRGVGVDVPDVAGRINHVTMLAVIEHRAQPEDVLREAHRILAPDGSPIITWPNAAVDPALHMLRKLGIVSQEMESEKHERRIR